MSQGCLSILNYLSRALSALLAYKSLRQVGVNSARGTVSFKKSLLQSGNPRIQRE